MGYSPDAHSPRRDSDFEAHALPLMPVIARIALALARDEADADDLVQETYLRAYRYWDSFVPGTDCRKWLGTICRNVFRDSKRRDREHVALDDPAVESTAAAELHVTATAVGLGDMYATLDLGPAIAEAIATLEPAFRDAVVLGDVEGYSYGEIADTLGVPVGTVRSRLYRGRRRLQEMLMAHAKDAGLGRGLGRKQGRTSARSRKTGGEE